MIETLLISVNVGIIVTCIVWSVYLICDDLKRKPKRPKRKVIAEYKSTVQIWNRALSEDEITRLYHIGGWLSQFFGEGYTRIWAE